MRCHCGGPATFQNCCEPTIAGTRAAVTATDLMKSRYSAFCVGNADHLLASWDPETRPDALDLSDDRTWLQLEIGTTTGGGPFDTAGTVEFYASYRDGGPDGPVGLLAEHSRFRRHDGLWVYLDGMFLEAPSQPGE